MHVVKSFQPSSGCKLRYAIHIRVLKLRAEVVMGHF